MSQKGRRKAQRGGPVDKPRGLYDTNSLRSQLGPSGRRVQGPPPAEWGESRPSSPSPDAPGSRGARATEGASRSPRERHPGWRWPIPLPPAGEGSWRTRTPLLRGGSSRRGPSSRGPRATRLVASTVESTPCTPRRVVAVPYQSKREKLRVTLTESWGVGCGVEPPGSMPCHGMMHDA